MQVNSWFPGHMAKSLPKIKRAMEIASLVIVVIDGRMPVESFNSNLENINPKVKRIFLISKIDLADKKKLNELTNEFEFSNSNILHINLKNQSALKLIFKKIKEVAKDIHVKKSALSIPPPLKIVILGMPNTGKSTLINLLIKKRKLKVSNTPGVTRGIQWVNHSNYFFLDTPGIMKPRLDNRISLMKLALINIVNPKIFDEKKLAYLGFKMLFNNYKFKLDEFGFKVGNELNEITIYDAFYDYAVEHKLRDKDDILRMDVVYRKFLNYFSNLKGITFL